MTAEPTGKLDLEDADLSIYVSNETERNWRATPTLHERGTVEWLRSMRPRATLFDIGANVGVFSLIAAGFGRTEYILAVEPAPENVWRIHQNLALNGFGQSVCVLNAAIGERSGVGCISSPEREPGSVGHTFIWTRQANARMVPCFTLDDLVLDLGYPVPTHIKIDVDGAEQLVLEGATRLLTCQDLESVNIEVDAFGRSADDIDERMTAVGFRLSHAYFDPLAAAEEPHYVKIENRIYMRI